MGNSAVKIEEQACSIGSIFDAGAMGERQLFPPLRIDQIIDESSRSSTVGDFHIDRFENFRQVIRHATFPHRHDFYNVILFTAGSGSHRIDFHDYSIEPGTTFFLTPGQIHSWELSDDVAGYNVLFSRSFLERNCAYPPLLDLPYFHSLEDKPLLKKDADRIEKAMSWIYQEFQRGQEADPNIIRVLTKLLLLEAARSYPASKPERFDLFRRFERLVDEHFLRLRTPSDYAGLLAITPNYLNVLCKRHSGKTAGSLIRERLVLEACRLLVHSDEKVAWIADRLGFEDPSYFSRFFRKQTGQSPEAFRTTHKPASKR